MKKLLLVKRIMLLPVTLLLLSVASLSAQTTVFDEDFSTGTGASYSTTTGAIGTSPNWSFTRSGGDMGARINSGYLGMTNDASGAANVSGWALAYTVSAAGSPFSPTLNTNPGLVTWTFNMRQSRSNPSGPASGYYADAFILAGTSNTTATSGSGYAVILGNNGKVDPLRLVRYTGGLRTSTNIISSNTYGLNDFGNQYLSVKVTYDPVTSNWSLYVRNDYSAFQDPLSGSLTLQGTASNTGSVATSLPLIGAFWNANTRKNQTAYFDNITVSVATPLITSLSPPSKIAGSGAFTLTVNGSNFTSGTVVRWNGSNRTTTYVSPTQLTVAIPATDITSSGTAAITAATGAAVSNSQTFTIDVAGAPAISTSTNVLAALQTVAGTASSTQGFTVSGANLTDNVTVTAPTGFEVSTAAASGFADAITLTRTGNALVGQPVTVYVRFKQTAPAGLYTGNVSLTTSGGATKQVAVSGKVLTTEPITSASAVTFTNVGASMFTVNWTAGSGASHLVVLRAASSVSATPTDGTSYLASATFGSGSDLGSNSFVVYAGAGTSVNVSGLAAATTYYVAVYEYNGSGGIENYKTSGPATGSRLTLNAPLGLQITAANTASTITFDSTVDGVNNGQYNGGGVDSVPQSGELNSYSWAFTGFADGNIAFGGSNADDTAYDSGTSDGGEVDAGLYAYEVSPGNVAMGVKPTTAEFSPGTISFRYQNQSATPITSISIGYKVYVYNGEAGSNSINFSYSSDNSTYTTVTSMAHTTPAATDGAPGWKAYYKVVTITGLNITTNNYGYLRWTVAAVSGTAFDEIALDDIVIVANPTSTFASFSGTAETFVVAGNAQQSGNVTVNSNIQFLNNSYLAISGNTLTLSGTVTNTSNGGLRGSNTSNLVINGAVSPTLSFDQSTGGTTNLLNNLSINTTASNTVTAGNAFAVNGTLTVDASQTLAMGTNILSGTLTTIVNNGTFTTQNTTAAPFTAGKSWTGTGTVILNAATAQQTLPAGTYNNITVSTTGGAVTTANVTVNGTLHLPNANPSATAGALATGTNTLFMGPNAVNTGTGDVSGIVTRNTGITSNVYYTFGHPQTSIIFPPVGTLPTSLSLRIVLGSAPAGKTDAILRTYSFIQTGGSGTKAILKSHYLDSELNGNTETKLVDWIVQVSPSAGLLEQSRTNYNTTDNYVELANVNVNVFSFNFGDMLLTMANYSNTSTVTWNGSASNVWIHAANWTPNVVPNETTNVIIPDGATTNFDPMIDEAGISIKTLSIETGGIINSPNNVTVTIKGSQGAWLNKGTFNPGSGTSKVAFSPADTTTDVTMGGNTIFNNLEIAAGILRVLTDNQIHLAGTFTKTGTFIAGSVDNIFDYAGTNQTVVTLNGSNSAYHNLVISGTGAVFPTALNVNGNLTLNKAVDFTGKTLLLTGTEDQTVGGTNAAFNNLTVNKSGGEVYLSANTAVTGTLTLTSGRLNLGAYNLTLGGNAVAGTFSTAAMIVADGTGVVRRPYTATGSYFFPIGEKTSNTTYSPVSVNITSGTFSNAYISVNVTDATHPDNHSANAYLTRYWNIAQTGITNAIATVTGTYVAGDAVGGEANLAAAQLIGTFNTVTNPWVRFTTLSGNTLTAAGAQLTAGQTSVFTGIAGATLLASIEGEGTFCLNDAVTLSSAVTGGSAPYTYIWSNGLGSAATATPPTAAAGSVTYTLTVRDANGLTATDTGVVTVSPAAVAGTLTGDQAICAGTTPAAITLAGYTGNIIRWERSINTGFTNPTFIAATTATLSGAQIGNLTGTRYLRAVIQSGSCQEIYSNYITVAVTTTTWNGDTWSNGAPTGTTAAVFTGNYTATGNLDACTLVVDNNAIVVIPSGFTVTLNGAITVTSGSFTLENNANLLQLTDVANSGNIIVKRNTSALFRLDYTQWSSPVNGSKTMQQFSPQTSANRFYTYNTSNDTYATIATSSTFAVGKGYQIRMPNGDATPGYNSGGATIIFTGVFEGVPNNGPVSTTLTDAGNGYNLIGNPYPSPLNITSFLTANSQVIDGTVWIWRKKNNPNSINSAYVTINSTGQYVGNNEPEQENPNGILRTGQGFIVKLKAGHTGNDVTFINSMRSADTSNQFFRMSGNAQAAAMPESHGIYLTLTNTSGFYSQMYTGYIEGATNAEDSGIDSRFINDSPTVLAALINNKEYIIQGRAMPFAISDVVPLIFRTAKAGTYTIAVDHAEGIFTQGQEVLLRDNLLGTVSSLDEAYSFTTDVGTFAQRFELIYSNNALGTPEFQLTPDQVMVYQKDKIITIECGSAAIDHVTLYDTRGRIIYDSGAVNTAKHVISSLAAEEQVLLVTVSTDKGTVKKKIIY